MPKTYEVEILGELYQYRGATRRELEAALDYESQYDMEDFICSLCVISPKIDLETCLAGIPSQLSEKILEASGMTPESTQKLQGQAEEWIKSPSGKMEILMMVVLHLSIDTIQEMDPPDWFKSAGAAQLLAASLYGLDVSKFISTDPFEQPKKGNRRPTPPPPNNPSGKIIPPPLLANEIPEAQLKNWEENQKHLISK